MFYTKFSAGKSESLMDRLVIKLELSPQSGLSRDHHSLHFSPGVSGGQPWPLGDWTAGAPGLERSKPLGEQDTFPRAMPTEAIPSRGGQGSGALIPT